MKNKLKIEKGRHKKQTYIIKLKISLKKRKENTIILTSESECPTLVVVLKMNTDIVDGEYLLAVTAEGRRQG